MMRAGSLDELVTFQSVENGSTESGAVAETWSTFATRRARRVKRSFNEAQRANGANTESTIVFRMRFIDGVTVADRVLYGGLPYNIRRVEHIGRRRETEIEVEWIGP